MGLCFPLKSIVTSHIQSFSSTVVTYFGRFLVLWALQSVCLFHNDTKSKIQFYLRGGI